MTIDKNISRNLLEAYNEHRLISLEDRGVGKTTSAVELAKAVSLYEDSSIKIVVPHGYMADAFNKQFNSPLHENIFIPFHEAEKTVGAYGKLRVIVDELTVRQVATLSLNPSVDILTGFISLVI